MHVRDQEDKTVSIHVPAKGTTTFIDSFVYFFLVSIHVPAKGTTAITYNFYL